MKYLALVCLLLLGGTEALKCYDCVDCQENVGHPKRCNRLENVCLKVELGTRIVRRCAESDICHMSKFERSASRIWTNIISNFRDADRDTHQEVHCCYYNYCNSGIQTLPNLFVLLMPLLIASYMKQ